VLSFLGVQLCRQLVLLSRYLLHVTTAVVLCGLCCA
jgi:hypothetical protein